MVCVLLKGWVCLFYPESDSPHSPGCAAHCDSSLFLVVVLLFLLVCEFCDVAPCARGGRRVGAVTTGTAWGSAAEPSTPSARLTGHVCLLGPCDVVHVVRFVINPVLHCYHFCLFPFDVRRHKGKVVGVHSTTLGCVGLVGTSPRGSAAGNRACGLATSPLSVRVSEKTLRFCPHMWNFLSLVQNVADRRFLGSRQGRRSGPPDETRGGCLFSLTICKIFPSPVALSDLIWMCLRVASFLVFGVPPRSVYGFRHLGRKLSGFPDAPCP